MNSEELREWYRKELNSKDSVITSLESQLREMQQQMDFANDYKTKTIEEKDKEIERLNEERKEFKEILDTLMVVYSKSKDLLSQIETESAVYWTSPKYESLKLSLARCRKLIQ